MAETPKDPPIENPSFVGGVNVVDIGDLRVARGLSRRPHSACNHHRLMYDNAERRVWCQDCETNVEAFDAFVLLVENLDRAFKDLERRREIIEKAESSSLISVAAKVMDKEWRHRDRVPSCPHCGQGLFPEDFAKGVGSLGREYARALAAKRKLTPEV